MNNYDVLIVGGGAAGFFAVINTAAQSPKLKTAILERAFNVLSKAKISGGGIRYLDCLQNKTPYHRYVNVS